MKGLEPTLDPDDWGDFRGIAREIVDATVADLENLAKPPQLAVAR